MLELFLKKLNRELNILKKNERKKYLQQYEEMVCEKKESGIEESVAVSELGDVKEIAREILDSYCTGDNGIRYEFCNINAKFILSDVLLLIVSYFIAFAVYVRDMSSMQGVDAVVYLCMLPVMVTMFIIFYLLCGMYTVEGVYKQPNAVYNIIRANVTGIVIIFWLFYFMKLVDFPRMIVLFAGVINLILAVIFRTFVLKAR